MTTVTWSETLELGQGEFDDTHREFMELLALAQQADDAGLPQAWQALIDHTVSHFGQEDRWMDETRFPSMVCHTGQHRVVLMVMREGMAAADRGDLAPVRGMIPELGVWFARHVQSMDASLVMHLRTAGFFEVSTV